MTEVDLVIVGAGPAGMSAAVTAAEIGLSVLLLDEQPAAGGQIYRNVAKAAGTRGDILGKDYTYGLALVAAVQNAAIGHVSDATVWKIGEDGTVAYSVNGKASVIQARKVIIATGALERPVPIPGWTLPGVMTAGAAQILLKQSGLVAERAVICGSGPLIYLIAQQMIRAGKPPLAIIETQTKSDLLNAMRHLPHALRGWRYLMKGAKLLSEIKRAGVMRVTGAENLRIEGDAEVRALAFTHRGKITRIQCDLVLLHQGVVPNTQATRSLRLEHSWSSAQRCFHPITNEWGLSSLETVYVAGDGAGIGGAKAAEQAGAISALHVAFALGFITKADRDKRAAPILRLQSAELALRPFLDRAYQPSDQVLKPADDTVICRCEEVTAGDIRAYAQLGCTGPNQTKAFGRSGMGPCQGRYCGLTVTELLSQETGTTPDAVGSYRIRPPLKPITLGELATLEQTLTDETKGLI